MLIETSKNEDIAAYMKTSARAATEVATLKAIIAKKEAVQQLGELISVAFDDVSVICNQYDIFNGHQFRNYASYAKYRDSLSVADRGNAENSFFYALSVVMGKVNDANFCSMANIWRSLKLHRNRGAHYICTKAEAESSATTLLLDESVLSQRQLASDAYELIISYAYSREWASPATLLPGYKPTMAQPMPRATSFETLTSLESSASSAFLEQGTARPAAGVLCASAAEFTPCTK